MDRSVILCYIILCTFNSNSLSPVRQGFPSVWDGDRFDHAPCRVIQRPPSWLDGYLFCQVCASYGDQGNKEGQKATHMFDAIGAMALFYVNAENSTFTGAYYPTRSYKIWNFHGRDFRKSSVAWGTFFSTVNVSAAKLWDPINTEFGSSPPNVGFWKINDTVLAGTESYHLSLSIDPNTPSRFRSFAFRDATPLLKGDPLIPLHMPMHERVDIDSGLIWATVSALNITSVPPSLHQVVFTIDARGTRTVQGVFDYSPFDPTQCSDDGVYLGDQISALFPRYMHSITSTKNFLILPLTSSVMNPCKVLNGAPSYPPNVTLYDPVDSWIFEWDPTAPMLFLFFDKRTKEFLEPLELETAQFVTHQFNAFELSPMHIFADMITADTDAYEALQVRNLTRSLDKYPLSAFHALRFEFDLEEGVVSNHSLLPQNPTAIEFPQFNHNFEGRPYQFGYAVTFPYLAGNQIVKIDMDTPSGINNKAFQPNGQSISLGEPSFVQAPGASEEDDGVLIVRGLDTSVNKTRIYVLNGKTLEQVGEILAPTAVPFGFHERFYTKDSLRSK